MDWFPEYTITEDYALGFELKAHGFKGTYLLQYLAMGEAPDEIRNVFRQRSRWTKGHWQVFLSKKCPLLHRKLPLMQKMWYSYGELGGAGSGWRNVGWEEPSELCGCCPHLFWLIFCFFCILVVYL